MTLDLYNNLSYNCSDLYSKDSLFLEDDMINLIWFFYAFVAFAASTKYYASKPLSQWSWKRKLYFSCWSAVVLISFINGFRCVIENRTFNFYAQFAIGIQWMLVAIVPCGMNFFNKPWPMRRFRDSIFIGIGALDIYIAFHL